MNLIIKSFFLAFPVMLRMVMPVIGVFVASIVIWSLLGLITGGFTTYLSDAITGMFITLLGIRVALSLLGDQRGTDYRMLTIYAVTYGLTVMIVSGATMFVTDLLALLAAGEATGGKVTLWNYANSEQNLQAVYFLTAIAWKAPLALLLFTTVHVLLAIPIANAGRAAGDGAPSTQFLSGIGTQFVPLFMVFGTSFFLQFFFELYSTIFAVFPVFVALIRAVMEQTLPELDLERLLPGIASLFGLLWLKSWTWSAATLALTAGERKSPQSMPTQKTVGHQTSDIRALREARERSRPNTDG